MKAKSKSKTSWPPILHRTYPSGQVAYSIAVMVQGKRIRETFKTLDAAETRAEQIRNSYREEGKAAFAMPVDLRLEATRCAEKLRPHSVTITEAVDHYIKHVIAYRTAPSVAEIVAKMIAETAGAGRRDRTIEDLRYRLGVFCKTFGNYKLSAITLEELKAWIDDPTLGARSKIHNATKVSQLYNYAIQNGWAIENLVKRIRRPSTEDKAPAIFTVEQAGNLLEHAADSDLLPFIAIGLFGGLRVAELQRLDWSAVKLAERSIIIGSEVAKRRSRRVVEINDTLAGWLALCAQPKGRVVNLTPVQFRQRRNKLAKAAGIATWPDNALRHTFASYHLALHGDAVKTAFQMGNSPTIVHNHYKGLVSNSDIQRYWKLRPAADADEKIVPIRAASA